jgi:hypothetical protein
MDKVLVKVRRESVCAGDDINAPHEYNFSIHEESTLNELFGHLARKKYLANVSGSNHSWEATIEGEKVAFFKGNNTEPQPSIILNSPVSKYAKNSQVYVSFKYNSANT